MTASGDMEKLNRRQFLEYSNRLMFGFASLTVSPLSLRASDVESLQLGQLSSREVSVLAEVCRLIFPHEKLPAAVYLDVVKKIDRNINDQLSENRMVREGVKKIERVAGGDWQEVPREKQIEILRSFQSGAFFRYIHQLTLDTLYRDPRTWELLGYEGSSIEHGGYLHRGFNDIDWLDP